MKRWDEWLAAGPPCTLKQEQTRSDMAVLFQDAVTLDWLRFPRQRNDHLFALALRALKAERSQDAAGG
jgi:hypothetical protein